MILLDTHVIIWAVLNSPKLGSKTKILLQTHEQAGTLLVSAFSFWEIELLIQKGRINLPMTTSVLRSKLLRQGIKEVPVHGGIGILSCQIDLHGDPADRIITASAIDNGAVLATADGKILTWQHPLQRHDARR